MPSIKHHVCSREVLRREAESATRQAGGAPPPPACPSAPVGPLLTTLLTQLVVNGREVHNAPHGDVQPQWDCVGAALPSCPARHNRPFMWRCSSALMVSPLHHPNTPPTSGKSRRQKALTAGEDLCDCGEKFTNKTCVSPVG